MAVTSVNDTNTSTTLLTASAAQTLDGASFTNTSTAILYLLQGIGTASATNYSVALQAGDYFETPSPRWVRGGVTGIWASDAAGAVLITTW